MSRFLAPPLSVAVALSSQLLGLQAIAAEVAGTRSSAEFGAVFGTIESAGNSNKSAQANLRFTTPIAGAFGASLRGSFADTNIQIHLPTTLVGTTACNYATLSGTGTLFAIRPTLGSLAASVLTTQLDSGCGSNASFLTGNRSSLRSTGYALEAEYYFPDFTLAAKRTVSTFTGDAARVTDMLSASWYPLSDLGISPSAGRSDGKLQYGLSILSQPDFLGRSTSVGLAFSSLDLEDDSIQTINLSFTYHFGAPVELKTRDRQYR